MKLLSRVLLTGVMVICLVGLMPTSKSWAASQVPDPAALLAALGVNPQAQGDKKVKGTLSVLYEVIDPFTVFPPSPDPFKCTFGPFPGLTVNMHVVARAKTRGGVFRPQAVTFREVCYSDVFVEQPQNLRTVLETLVTKLCPDGFISWEVKKLKNLLEDEPIAGSDDNAFMVIADFKLAVDTGAPPQPRKKRDKDDDDDDDKKDRRDRDKNDD